MVNALAREMVNALRASALVHRSAFALRELKCSASLENVKASISFALARFLSLTIHH